MVKNFLLIFAVFTLFSTVKAQKTSFLQIANYDISININPREHCANGHVKIQYVNNSGRTLQDIYILLWPNAYTAKSKYAKNIARYGNDRLVFKEKTYGGYIDSLKFKINGKYAPLESKGRHPEYVRLIATKPVKPGDTITVSTPFYLKLPYNNGRLGYNNDIIQLTNWYPRIAKLTDNGWQIDYYNEDNALNTDPGNYKVTITIPKQYVVIATGKLQDKAEKQWINQLSFNGQKGVDYANPSGDSLKTITFTASNINDFIIAASSQYYTLSSSIKLKGKTFKTYAFFTDRNILAWLRATSLLDTVLKYNALWLDTLPYQTFSLVQGAMDNYYSAFSANVAIISPLIKDSEILELAAFNAVNRTYFRNILGIDEIDYPFLSLGLNSAYTYRYQKLKKLYSFQLPITAENLNILLQLMYTFGYDTKTNGSIYKYTPATNNVNLKLKPAILFEYFRLYTQEAKKLDYDSVMNKFLDTFMYQSPDPGDLAEIFSQSPDSTDFRWFLNAFYAKNKKIDYKAHINRNKIKIKSTKATSAPMPLTLGTDSVSHTVWTHRKPKSKLPNNGFKSVVIDSGFITPDFNRYNNFSKTGLCHKKQKHLPHLFVKLKPYNESYLNLLPAVWYGSSEGIMAGLGIHNITLPLHKINFVLVPLYSYKQNQPFSYAYASTKFTGPGIIPDLTITAYADRLNNTVPVTVTPEFLRTIKTGLTFSFHNAYRNDKFTKLLSLKYTNTFNAYDYTYDANALQNAMPEYKNYFSAEGKIIKNSLYRPFNLTVHYEYFPGKHFNFYYVLMNRKFHYTNLNNGLEIRLFAGRNVLLSGFIPQNDYNYSHYFLFHKYSYEQNPKNILSHQFYYGQGGFAYYSPTTVFDRFLLSGTATTTLPLTKMNFVKAYASLAYGSYTNYSNVIVNSLFYEYGVKIDLSPVNIFIPLGGTFKSYNESIVTPWYWHIRLSVNPGTNTTFLDKLVRLER